MRRRDFIMVLSSAAVWPVAARAQQMGLPVAGVLNTGLADAPANNVATREATRIPTATRTFITRSQRPRELVKDR